MIFQIIGLFVDKILVNSTLMGLWSILAVTRLLFKARVVNKVSLLVFMLSLQSLRLVLIVCGLGWVVIYVR